MIMNTQVLMHNEVGADELHYEPTRHNSISVWSAHAFIIQLILASFAKVASLEFTEWGV